MQATVIGPYTVVQASDGNLRVACAVQLEDGRILPCVFNKKGGCYEAKPVGSKLLVTDCLSPETGTVRVVSLQEERSLLMIPLW